MTSADQKLKCQTISPEAALVRAALARERMTMIRLSKLCGIRLPTLSGALAAISMPEETAWRIENALGLKYSIVSSRADLNLRARCIQLWETDPVITPRNALKLFATKIRVTLTPEMSKAAIVKAIFCCAAVTPLPKKSARKQQEPRNGKESSVAR